MFHSNFMSDIQSGTMKKLSDLPKFCLVCLAGPAVNDNNGDGHYSSLG